MMAAVLVLGSVLAFSGCTKKKIAENGLTGENVLMGTVQEVLDGSLLVEISEEYEEAGLYETLCIPNWFSGKIEEGDTIWIRHNGKFLKTSPTTIAEILEMKVTDENGVSEHVIVD